MFAVKAPVLCVPLLARAPLQPPDAVHAVALVELHVNVDAAPLATVVGSAVKVAVGVATGFTFTVTVLTGLLPPGPVHTSEKSVSDINAPVLCDPLVESSPLQPLEALQDVAFAEVHVSVESSP